jgi:nucleotide-binding universal stress UspA family protein
MGEIVVGYDGSGGGKAALDKALRLAKSLGDRVVVVFGYAPPGLWGGEIVEHEDAIEELGTKLMAEAESQAAPSGVETELKLVPKKPSEALIEIADERDARMIVVGSYGESPLKGAILGSTAYRLLHTSAVPVLVVPTRR